MSACDGLARGLRDAALLCVAFLLPLLLVVGAMPAKAQNLPPPGLGEGWVQMSASGTAYGGPTGTFPLTAVAAYQFVIYAKTMCSDPFVWGAVGTAEPGAVFYMPYSCMEPDYSSTVITGSETWFRPLYASSPPPAASAASAVPAGPGDIDRVVRGIQAVLAAWVLAAGVAGYRLGLSS